MSLLPPLKRIYEQDVENSISPLLALLNNIFQSLWNALNRNLTFQENIRSQVINIDYVGGSTINISTNLKAPLLGVLVLQTAIGPVTGGVMAVWQQTGQVVEIKQITGLTAGSQYKLRLLLI